MLHKSAVFSSRRRHLNFAGRVCGIGEGETEKRKRKRDRGRRRKIRADACTCLSSLNGGPFVSRVCSAAIGS